MREIVFSLLVLLQGAAHAIEVARCPEGGAVVFTEHLGRWLVIAVSGGRGCLPEGTFRGCETPGHGTRDGGRTIVVHLEHVVAHAVLGVYKLRTTYS